MTNDCSKAMHERLKGKTQEVKVILRITQAFMLFVICTVNIRAQNNSTDSLLRLLELSHEDTSKVNLLNNIAIEYTRTDLGKMFHYASIADSISRKVKYPQGRAESHRNLGIYYMRKSDFANAFNHLELAFTMYLQLNDYDGIANSLLNIGGTYSQMSKYDSALYHYQKSLEYRFKTKIINKERVAATYNNIGLVYRKQGNLPLSLEYYQKSLILKEEINDKVGLSDTYNNIGVIYKVLNDYKESINSYKKSLKIRKEIGYQRGIAICYNNIAISYLNDNQLDSAVYYASEGLKLTLEINQKRSAAYSYNILGDIYLRKTDFQLALSFFEQGYKLAEETGNQTVKISTYIGLGELKFKQSDFEAALTYGKLAYGWASEAGDISMIQHSSKLIAEASAALGKYNDAFNYFVIYKSMSDSVLNDANTKKVIGLEYEFKYQKDKIENDKIQFEQQVKLVKQKQITLTFLIGFILLLTLVFLTFTNLRRKQRDFQIISNQKNEIEQSNKLLNLQKDEIKTQNELLIDQAQILSELNELKSRFFANISHELRTPLTLILTPLNEIIDTGKYDKEAFEVMLRNAQKLRNMIDNLLELARMEKGAVDLQIEEADINELLNGVVHSFEGMANEKMLKIETFGLDKVCKLCFDKEGMEKVISNLLSNAIKFTPFGNRVKVTAEYNDQFFTLCVSDQGIGIPEDEIEKIFNRFFRSSNSKMYAGTGIGLSLVSDIVTMHGGTIVASHSPMGGTDFLVKIPFKRSNILDVFDEKENNELIANDKDTLSKNKKTLLVVEDNTDLRNFLVSALSQTYNVLEAEDGKIGLDIASSEYVDIIISDVIMPIMDGYSLTKTIKNNAELCHIPVVLLTAKSRQQNVITGLLAEADAYITKPFSLNHLKAVLESQLKIRQKLHKKYLKEFLINPSELTTTSMDEQLIANAIKVVEENISNESFNVDNFCEALLMSRTSVHRKITAITGLSTSDFIRNIRLKRSVQLIKGQVASISEIAFMVGFSDVSYFSKCFKKEFGVTPSEFLS